MADYILWFDQLGMNDINVVGGKNASLGEMISNLANMGVSVPGGFATTTHAYRDFLNHDGLHARINDLLDTLDVSDIVALTEAGKVIRGWLMDAPLPEALMAAVKDAYTKLVAGSGDTASFAVRSSATAEDLPDASFAGQQETFLNVRGFDNVVAAIKEVFASLYNDRAISYRVHQNFDHDKVYLSAGIQKMVRSDIGASGVMFTLDTESGFRDAAFITGAYGLGETVVQGAVNPDEFYVYKPNLINSRPAILSRRLGSKAIEMVYDTGDVHDKAVLTREVDEARRRQFCLTDAQVEELAKMALIIEKHYGRPMDIEWALDGGDGQLYIVQARPETVESRADATTIERYQLEQKGELLVEGRAIGQKIGKGTAR
ncbi:MAG: PEP/pyruvate-binding domain-containing protein, partial [Thiolinea sp.]